MIISGSSTAAATAGSVVVNEEAEIAAGSSCVTSGTGSLAKSAIRWVSDSVVAA